MGLAGEACQAALLSIARQRERSDYAMSGINLPLRAQMQRMWLSVQIRSDG